MTNPVESISSGETIFHGPSFYFIFPEPFALFVVI